MKRNIQVKLISERAKRAAIDSEFLTESANTTHSPVVRVQLTEGHTALHDAICEAEDYVYEMTGTTLDYGDDFEFVDPSEVTEAQD